MRLVNKGIEFEGAAYVYKTDAEAKRIMEDIKAVSKFHKVNIHQVLFDTCEEIVISIIR